MQILHIANSDKVVDYRGFDVVVSVLHRSYKRRNLKKIGISDFSLVTRYNTNKYLSHKLCHLDEGEIPPVKNIQLPQYISLPAEGKQQPHTITPSQLHKKTKNTQYISPPAEGKQQKNTITPLQLHAITPSQKTKNTQYISSPAEGKQQKNTITKKQNNTNSSELLIFNPESALAKYYKAILLHSSFISSSTLL